MIEPATLWLLDGRPTLWAMSPHILKLQSLVYEMTMNYQRLKTQRLGFESWPCPQTSGLIASLSFHLILTLDMCKTLQSLPGGPGSSSVLPFELLNPSLDLHPPLFPKQIFCLHLTANLPQWDCAERPPLSAAFRSFVLFTTAAYKCLFFISHLVVWEVTVKASYTFLPSSLLSLIARPFFCCGGRVPYLMSTAHWDNGSLDLCPPRKMAAFIWCWDPLQPLSSSEGLWTKRGEDGRGESLHQFVCHILWPPRPPQPTQTRWCCFHLSADPVFTLQAISHPRCSINRYSSAVCATLNVQFSQKFQSFSQIQTSK